MFNYTSMLWISFPNALTCVHMCAFTCEYLHTRTCTLNIHIDSRMSSICMPSYVCRFTFIPPRSTYISIYIYIYIYTHITRTHVNIQSHSQNNHLAYAVKPYSRIHRLISCSLYTVWIPPLRTSGRTRMVLMTSSLTSCVALTARAVLSFLRSTERTTSMTRLLGESFFLAWYTAMNTDIHVCAHVVVL